MARGAMKGTSAKGKKAKMDEKMMKGKGGRKAVMIIAANKGKDLAPVPKGSKGKGCSICCNIKVQKTLL